MCKCKASAEESLSCSNSETKHSPFSSTVSITLHVPLLNCCCTTVYTQSIIVTPMLTIGSSPDQCRKARISMQLILVVFKRIFIYYTTIIIGLFSSSPTLCTILSCQIFNTKKIWLEIAGLMLLFQKHEKHFITFWE